MIYTFVILQTSSENRKDKYMNTKRVNHHQLISNVLILFRNYSLFNLDQYSFYCLDNDSISIQFETNKSSNRSSKSKVELNEKYLSSFLTIICISDVFTLYKVLTKKTKY